jgi:hypothetical protein
VAPFNMDMIMFTFVVYSGPIKLEIPEESAYGVNFHNGEILKIYSGKKLVKTCNSVDDIGDWYVTNERLIWSKDLVKPKDHINPSHYQGYIQELQWLESMQYLPRFRNPESFIAAVELQGRKYWDRNGGKDEEAQELQKGIWYFKFLLAYILNDRKPIRVADINRLIGDMGQGTGLNNDEWNELQMLRRYARVTASSWSNMEWGESLFSNDLTKEEIAKLKEY